eukprot:16430488-Heterocapsa_arctica.AAC.1
MKVKEKEQLTAEKGEAENNIVDEHMDAETADEENIESKSTRDNSNNNIKKNTDNIIMEEMHIKFMEEMSKNKKNNNDNNIMGEMYKEKVIWSPD